MFAKRHSSAACGVYRAKKGYTLIEVIVALGIVSALVLGVFVPILDTSRDVARRIQCQYHLRELGTGILNLESSKRVFPSGGTHPWPRISLYLSDSSFSPTPFGPEKQGLGWIYQILPYLPNEAAPQPAHEVGLSEYATDLFFCPARRGQARSIDQPHRLLNDYVAIMAPPSRQQLGKEAYQQLLEDDLGCRSAFGFWGSRSPGNDHMPKSADTLGDDFLGFYGVVVRGSNFVLQDGKVVNLNYGDATTLRRIRDGVTKTAMITEKHVPREGYPTGDTLGWPDGWGFDTLRYSMCRPVQDRHATKSTDAWSAGSNHPGGINVMMVDSSIRNVSYEVDIQLWHNMGHREDGEVTTIE